MNAKILTLMVILVGIFILMLPDVFIIFQGTHIWYNIKGKGIQIPCKKCHSDIFEELDQSDIHKDWGIVGKADEEDCLACHRSNLSIQYAYCEGNYVVSGKQAHAVSIVACMLCHQLYPENSTWVCGFYAGGFNISKWIRNDPFRYSDKNHTGLMSAHNKFIVCAIKSKYLPDSTEACIACHTQIKVRIHWQYPTYMNISWDYANDRGSISAH